MPAACLVNVRMGDLADEYGCHFADDDGDSPCLLDLYLATLSPLLPRGERADTSLAIAETMTGTR